MAKLENIGREMGNTPVPPAARSEPKPNRFRNIFTAVTFKAASPTSKVYGADEDRASKKLASVTVEICNSGAHVQGSIKAVQSKGESTPHAEFLFMASQYGGQAIKADDAQVAQELAEWRHEVVLEYLRWRKANGGGSLPPSAVPLDDIGSIL